MLMRSHDLLAHLSELRISQAPKCSACLTPGVVSILLYFSWKAFFNLYITETDNNSCTYPNHTPNEHFPLSPSVARFLDVGPSKVEYAPAQEEIGKRMRTITVSSKPSMTARQKMEMVTNAVSLWVWAHVSWWRTRGWCGHRWPWLCRLGCDGVDDGWLLGNDQINEHWRFGIATYCCCFSSLSLLYLSLAGSLVCSRLYAWFTTKLSLSTNAHLFLFTSFEALVSTLSSGWVCGTNYMAPCTVYVSWYMNMAQVYNRGVHFFTQSMMNSWQINLCCPYLRGGIELLCDRHHLMPTACALPYHYNILIPYTKLTIKKECILISPYYWIQLDMV